MTALEHGLDAFPEKNAIQTEERLRVTCHRNGTVALNAASRARDLD